jgi:hypothetical protein
VDKYGQKDSGGQKLELRDQMQFSVSNQDVQHSINL